MAGGKEYAEFKVAKNKWTEQYNDLRENQFKTWKFNRKTGAPVLILSLALPVTWFYMFTDELKTNMKGNGRAGFNFMGDKHRFTG